MCLWSHSGCDDEHEYISLVSVLPGRWLVVSTVVSQCCVSAAADVESRPAVMTGRFTCVTCT